MTIPHSSKKYYISISEKIVLGPPAYPDVNQEIVYLYAEKWAHGRDFKFKVRQTPNGDSYTASKGKKVRTIELTKCIISKDGDEGGAATNTLARNRIITLLDSWSDLDESPVFLIITPIVDQGAAFEQPTVGDPDGNDRVINLALSRKGSTEHDYMKGYVRKIRERPLGGVFTFDIQFIESTLL